jgi:hypothetical protein
MAESFLQHALKALRAGAPAGRDPHGYDNRDRQMSTDPPGLRPRPSRCEIEASLAIAAETARRLSYGASVLTLVEDPRRQLLDIGASGARFHRRSGARYGGP